MDCDERIVSRRDGEQRSGTPTDADTDAELEEVVPVTDPELVPDALDEPLELELERVEEPLLELALELDDEAVILKTCDWAYCVSSCQEQASWLRGNDTR